MSKRINPFMLFIGAFVPNWLLIRPEISPGEKLCYARLCQFAGRNGIAFPKLETLAKELACSVSQVQRNLNVLIEQGLIEKDRAGLQASNHYYFLEHRWMSEEMSSDVECAKVNNQTCSDMHNQTCSDMHNQTCAKKTGLYNEIESKTREDLEVLRTSSSAKPSGRIEKRGAREIKPTPLQKKEANPPLAKPVKRGPKVSELAQEVIDYWCSKGFHMHREDSTAFEIAVDKINRLFAKTLFVDFEVSEHYKGKWDMSDVRKAIDNFHLAVNSLDHMPANKKWIKKTSFNQFLYNPRINTKYEVEKSLFLKYYLQKPELVSKSRVFSANDMYPQVTKIFENWWTKSFSADRWALDTPTRNHFIFTGRKIKTFIEENKNRFLFGTNVEPMTQIARRLTECFDKELRENDSLYSIFNSSWLLSEKTFTERLPRYLIGVKDMRLSKEGKATESRYEIVYV